LPSEWRKNCKTPALDNEALEEMETAVVEAPAGDHAEDFRKNKNKR